MATTPVVLPGEEFRRRRELVCADRQVFSWVSGVPYRTIASYELGETERPKQYPQLMSTLRRFELGEISEESTRAAMRAQAEGVGGVVDAGEHGQVRRWDLGEGRSFTLRASDFTTLKAWHQAVEAAERLVAELTRPDEPGPEG